VGRVQDKVALATGGASGIGLSATTLLSKVGVADFNLDGATQVAQNILNFTSRAGINGDANQASYAAAKEAIRAITRVTAIEFGQFGNTIASTRGTGK
jgi:NAD(P)-dependent dehydrogenase (short-subunit alcohol dehydrogenase family)